MDNKEYLKLVEGFDLNKKQLESVLAGVLGALSTLTKVDAATIITVLDLAKKEIK